MLSQLGLRLGKTPTISPSITTRVHLPQSHNPHSFVKLSSPNLAIRSYSEAKKPRKTKVPSVLWVRKQAEKRKWKLEQKRGEEINLPEFTSSKSLAACLGVRTIDILKVLIRMNECPQTSDEYLNNDLVDMVVYEFGRVPIRGRDSGIDVYPRTLPDDLSIFPTRAPVVTIMGHVDHGKTTLLDALRGSNSHIADNEFGGITQRMAAFSVKPVGNPGTITFVDTPGHAAFGKMRQRGAELTDIAILVVAADEGIQEQTEQAIKFIQDSGCAMIVALTKCDKRNADPEKVRLQLNAKGVFLAKYGGDIPDVEVSAVEGEGLEELTEQVLYTAEDIGLHADQTGPAEAEILDVKKEDYRGVVASCILRLGEIKKNDAMIAGAGWGKVKHLFDEYGKIIKEVKPGMPFEVSGWEVAPTPGDELIVCADLAKAKAVAAHRKLRNTGRESDRAFSIQQRREFKEKEMEQKDKIQAVELGLDPANFVRKQQKIREQFKIKEVPMFLKADSGGSIEAIKDSLLTLPAEEVKIMILRAEVGSVSEQDVKEATMLNPKALVVGFNSAIPERVKELAGKEGVEVNSFKLIYGLMDWVRAALGKHLKPREHIKVLAEAQVLQIFPITVKKETIHIAGCLVTSGIFKKRLCQVVRNGQVVFEGPVRSLRHVKNEAKEITSGKECGVLLAGESALVEVGDFIQNIEKSYHARTLGEPLVSKAQKVEEDL